MKKIQSTIRLIVKISLMIFCTSAMAFDKWQHKDWVCFIDPFDLNPENRINVLGSLDKAWVLHVEKNGKKLLDQKKLGIRMIKNIDNMRSFGLTDGTAMSIMIDTSFGFNKSTNGRKLEIKGEWHPATYFKGHAGGGFSYRCKPVELVRD